jgi:uncharacterized protein YjbI with pentapeptide repeats
METKQRWYTRRNGQVRGPFPAPQISRFILLGRIQESDELSTDQHVWQKVSEVPVLLPEELQADLNDPEAFERLKIARMREDERDANDRRGERAGDAANRERRNVDLGRRQYEEEEVIRHREIKTAIAEAEVQRKHHYFLRGVFTTLVLASVIVAAMYYQPSPLLANVECDAVATPGVNWDNCQKVHVSLPKVDLRGATLRNVKMEGANLSSANLSGAMLDYANLVAANLSKTTLSQATLLGANLRGADLSGSDLVGADLSFAILQNADLSDSNFGGVNLNNADLRGATLNNTNLKGVQLGHTIWVDGRVCNDGSVGQCRLETEHR